MTVKEVLKEAALEYGAALTAGQRIDVVMLKFGLDVDAASALVAEAFIAEVTR